MFCKKCQGTNLVIYNASFFSKLNQGFFDIITYTENIDLAGRFVFSCEDCDSGGILRLYDNSILVKRKSVFEEGNDLWEKLEDKVKFRYPKISQEKVVLDLDNTLIREVYSEEESDFSMEYGRLRYFKIRPHWRQFYDYLKNNFKEVEIITAATRAYAEEVAKFLKFDGKISSLEDLGQAERTKMAFEREYLKRCDNSLVFDDKPEVIFGEGNFIFCKRYDDEDSWLSDVISIIEERKKDTKHYEFPTEFNLSLRQSGASHESLNLEMIGKIKLNDIDELTDVLIKYCPLKGNRGKTNIYYHFGSENIQAQIHFSPQADLVNFKKDLAKIGLSFRENFSNRDLAKLYKDGFLTDDIIYG